MNGLFYKRYVNDSGLGTLAPADAATPSLKDDHWGLVYGGGLFAGLCIDMEIRNNTRNQNSLDDLMRYYFNHFAATDRLINNDDLLQKANELGETDFISFVDTYVKGVATPPLEDYLCHAGIEVSRNDQQLLLQQRTQKTNLQQQLWKGFLGVAKE
jgi:predicted metalloprotease with PDZ domain